MMTLSLLNAFGRFGAKPSNRLGSLSAMAADGAMVLSCRLTHFSHPARGVLRYETSLSAALAAGGVVRALSEHLTRALDGDLPVRMIVAQPDQGKIGKAAGYYIRPDLIGKVAEFDGDRFVVDFTRPPTEEVRTTSRRRK